MGKIRKNALSMPVFFEKVEDFNGDDIRFTKVKIFLLHLGLNENGCELTKEVVDEAIPSLGYIPIVGYIDTFNDDFTVHKYEKVYKNGELHRKYKGQAYGVVLSSQDNNAHYEERECEDGITRTFLVVDGILWNQFEDSIEIMNRDMIKNHSMELVDVEDEKYLDGYEDEDNIFHFTKITFRGACILGNKVEPAMINSTIEVQNEITNFAKAIQMEIADKMEEFSKVYDFQKNKTTEKRSDKEDMSKTGKVNTDFSLTGTQLIETLRGIVYNHEKVFDRWGDEVSKYYFVDTQEDFVIVSDREGNLLAFPFTVNGDSVNVDFSQEKKMKITFVEFQDGEDETNAMTNFQAEIEHAMDIADKEKAKNTEFEKKIEEIEKNHQEELEDGKKNFSKVETEYKELKADYDEIKPKYDEFCKKEQEAMEEAIAEQKKALFTKFDSHLSDVADYAKLKEEKDTLSVDEIESKCSVMYAKKELNKTTDFSKKGGTDGLDLPEDNKEHEGMVLTKYGYISVDR